ncbi:hypothetical protein RTM1035_17830 [Roseovarius sp. TM1035]|nr:hypothetical protein RTM1035_17830 [Roseovarius sp. TM1035]
MGWPRTWSIGPLSATWPACRKITSSPMRRAWPMSCVIMTMVTPRPWAALIRSSILWVDAGSRLLVGSSRNRRRGLQINARAKASRCCSPPDSTRAGCRARSLSPAISRARAACSARSAPRTPCTERAKFRLASTERRSITGR